MSEWIRSVLLLLPSYLDHHVTLLLPLLTKLKSVESLYGYVFKVRLHVGLNPLIIYEIKLNSHSTQRDNNMYGIHTFLR